MKWFSDRVPNATVASVKKLRKLKQPQRKTKYSGDARKNLTMKLKLYSKDEFVDIGYITKLSNINREVSKKGLF